MKIFKVFSSVILSGVICVSLNSCSNSEGKASTKKEINTENVVVAEYNVDGMVCAMGCAKTIQDELAAMNGVASCEVSFENATAHIEYDKTQLSENELIAVIEGLADGKYKVNKTEGELEKKIEEGNNVEESEESEETISEVKLPSFEIPNLLELLFKQV